MFMRRNQPNGEGVSIFQADKQKNELQMSKVCLVFV